MAKEMVLALMVLALVFFNFGHQAPAVAYTPDLTAYVVADGTPGILCDQHQGTDHDHDPCHVCRLGAGLDLPPAPCAAETAFLTVAAVAYENADAGFSLIAAPQTPRARAPPLA
jgi:hypothetical protein